MIESAIFSHSDVSSGQNLTLQRGSKTLSYAQNDRMAGSVPVWTHIKTVPAVQEKVPVFAHTLAQIDDVDMDALAQEMAEIEPGTEVISSNEASDIDAEEALVPEAKSSQVEDESFGFDDFIDIINPLQHIPLVGSAYRHLTGDQIKPVLSIVGGGIFGGPIGAVGALAKNVIEDYSGQDATDWALSGFSGDHVKTTPNKVMSSAPEDALSAALDIADAKGDGALSSTLLSFSDLSSGASKPAARYVPYDDERTAGYRRLVSL